MSSRYGRNKRRAHREEIERLDTALKTATYRAERAERSIAYAREDGMNHILKIRYLPLVIERIGEELSRAYGPEIEKAAKQIVASSQPRRDHFVDLRAAIDPIDTSVTRISGRIPELHYNVHVSNF